MLWGGRKMRSTQKITRLQLKINQPEDVSIFGIVSSEPDYKISLTLNKKFRISLKNILPVTISDGGNELTFSRFSDSIGVSEVVFSLISNRTGKNFLLKRLKNVDYIFLIQEPDNEYNTDFITTNLKEIDSITAVFVIDSNSITDKYLRYLIH